MQDLKCKRFVTGLMAVLIFLTTVFCFNLTANAASINDEEVFVKQQTSYTCTLVSAEMMLRRKAIILGLEDWDKITETELRPYGWAEGYGLWFDFDYTLNDVTMHVHNHDFVSTTASGRVSELIELLETHPEGVEIYHDTPAKSHAILITDYTDGVFYCADPAGPKNGRIKLTESTLYGIDDCYTDEEIIGICRDCWYISSPEGPTKTDLENQIPTEPDVTEPETDSAGEDLIQYEFYDMSGNIFYQAISDTADVIEYPQAPEYEGYLFVCWNKNSFDTKVKKLTPFYVYKTDISGDTDGNGVIDSTDSILDLQYYSEIISNLYLPSADYNNDGIINSDDAILILQKYSNII